ncbi:hypothetical protein DFH29DRAFT_1069358 [Suillus ampliporus]|nr:hypothetical protein DFH29DRAFT_1069358 [Suillus ampliporus]
MGEQAQDPFGLTLRKVAGNIVTGLLASMGWIRRGRTKAGPLRSDEAMAVCQIRKRFMGNVYNTAKPLKVHDARCVGPKSSYIDQGISAMRLAGTSCLLIVQFDGSWAYRIKLLFACRRGWLDIEDEEVILAFDDCLPSLPTAPSSPATCLSFINQARVYMYPTHAANPQGVNSEKRRGVSWALAYPLINIVRPNYERHGISWPLMNSDRQEVVLTTHPAGVFTMTLLTERTHITGLHVTYKYKYDIRLTIVMGLTVVQVLSDRHSIRLNHGRRAIVKLIETTVLGEHGQFLSRNLTSLEYRGLDESVIFDSWPYGVGAS